MGLNGRTTDSAATRSRHRDWAQVRRLLCVRLDSLGDVLMTAPALRAAKRSGEQDRHLTLLTSPAGAEAARLLPDVDEVLIYEAPWVKATPPRPSSAEDHRFIRRLAALELDAAVIFTVYSQTPLPAAMTCWLANIPRRLAHCRVNPYQLLTDSIPDPEPDTLFRHEVRRQLDLVSAVGWRSTDERMQLRIPSKAQARTAERLARHGFTARHARASNGGAHPFDDSGTGHWAVLHPGASASSRRYSPKHYATVLRMLAESHGWRFVLTGTESERALLEQIRKDVPSGVVVLACDLPLGELAALLEQAPLLISNNTGPVHVAAAVGTPVVDLYALTNLQHTPWQVPSRVLFTDVPCRCCYKSICPEGHHRCLDSVPPERVVEAALELAGSDIRQDRVPDLPADILHMVEPRSSQGKAPATAVDVLIPSFRRSAALAVTLTGLAAQTYRNFRVIVSDQTERHGLPPGEVLAASRVLEAHGCKVRLLQHLPRRGVAENRDYLLAQSDAPFVLCLDDDLILEPFMLEMLVKVLEQERCGFVGSAVIGLSFASDRRPEEQAVTFWEGPVEPEEVLPNTREWERFKLHNAANLWHVQQRIGASPEAPRRYRVAWVSGCVLYDAAKLRGVGGFSFWRSLPEAHCGEDVLAQLRVMKAYGGCGVMPSGVYHQELPTTLPQREVDAARTLNVSGATTASFRPS